MSSRTLWICRGLASVGLCLVLLPAASMQPEPITEATIPEPPQVLFKGLFNAVQSARLFADSKTFADAVPKWAPPEILARYRDANPVSREALKSFVAASFLLPGEASAPKLSTERVTITRHIDSLWDQLTRATNTAPRYSSLPVIRKNSIRHTHARKSIRDAVRQESIWLGRRTILRDDGVNLAGVGLDRWAADPVHPDPAPCADAQHCSEGSRISEWTANAIRTWGSANPGTRAEGCR